MERLEGLARELAVGAIKLTKGEVGLVLGEDAAEEGGAVGEGDEVAFVGGIDGLIRVEDRGEESFLATVGDGTEVGAVCGEAFCREVTDGAELVEGFAACSFVALEFESGEE